MGAVGFVMELDVRDLRNIETASLRLSPGLNVLQGRNAQGKTSVLEAVAFVSRGRSFRTDDATVAIRRGTEGLTVEALATQSETTWRQRLRLANGKRVFELDGKEVGSTEYGERLEALVYSNDRVRALQASTRERRSYLDRGGSRLWSAYRQIVRDYGRTLAQKNAALRSDTSDLSAWNERLARTGGALRHRRLVYAARLGAALGEGQPLTGECIELRVKSPHEPADEGASIDALACEIETQRQAERRAGRCLCGPHRDAVDITVDGQDISQASSGQARTAVLALLLASLDVYNDEKGRAAVTLLDDLDSELDDERTQAVCQAVVRRGQTLVTTAHRGWAETLGPQARVFHVDGGRVSPAS